MRRSRDDRPLFLLFRPAQAPVRAFRAHQRRAVLAGRRFARLARRPALESLRLPGPLTDEQAIDPLPWTDQAAQHNQKGAVR